MSIETLILPLLTALVVGLGAGYVGSLMVLRRMSLVGDALSHVALPGLAVALLYNVDPFLGALVALVGAVIAIWALEKRTNVPTEALVGVVFTLSLAAGLLLTPEPELLEALFGDISTVTFVDLVLSVMTVLGVVGLLSVLSRKLVLSTLSPDLAKANGIKVDAINFWFLVSVALIVSIGIKVTGTLLTGALVIISASTARNVTSSLSRFMATSAALGALSGALGVILSTRLDFAPGPVIVLVGGALFGLSVLKR